MIKYLYQKQHTKCRTAHGHRSLSSAVSDPQALGAAQFSDDTMTNIALYLLKNMKIFVVI